VEGELVTCLEQRLVFRIGTGSVVQHEGDPEGTRGHQEGQDDPAVSGAILTGADGCVCAVLHTASRVV
jgi:hypothetical protein